jgi:hypothetical protein
LAGLALALLVALGLNGIGPLDLRAQVARQDLSAALDRYSNAPAVHVRGAFDRDGHPYQVDVTIDKNGDSQGTVVSDGTKVEERYVGGHAYALAGQDFWSGQGKLAAFYANRWVTSSDQLADLTTPSLSRSLALLDVARPGASFGRVSRTARVGGVAAVVLSDTYGELYVSTAAPMRFLRLVSSPRYRTADGIADIDVDLGFPPAQVVQAPSPLVSTDDPTTLPAQYVVDESSIQHGHDCDVGSTCTISVAVVNQRGPQFGPASAEVHLVRDDGSDLGTCTVAIGPAAHGQSQTVSCTVSGSAWVAFTRVGGRYRAEVTVQNPLYDG